MMPSNSSKTSATLGDPNENSKGHDPSNNGGPSNLETGILTTSRPPELPFSPYDHKTSTAIFWMLIASEACFIPVSLYYCLWYGTNLKHGVSTSKLSPCTPSSQPRYDGLTTLSRTVFAIITSVFGFVSGYEYTVRGIKLFRAPHHYQPLNGFPKWYTFDFGQWLLLTPYTIMTGILIGGSVPNEPLVNILATPMSVFMMYFGIVFCLSYIWTSFALRLPFRMSSHVKGDIAPPVIYAIIEDVCAVDNNCGRQFRTALRARYDASWRFRRMLRRLTLFWGLPSLVIGVGLVIIVCEVENVVSYGLGWSVPAIWAALWTTITIPWVRRELFVERSEWAKDQIELKKNINRNRSQT